MPLVRFDRLGLQLPAEPDNRALGVYRPALDRMLSSARAGCGAPEAVKPKTLTVAENGRLLSCHSRHRNAITPPFAIPVSIGVARTICGTAATLATSVKGRAFRDGSVAAQQIEASVDDDVGDELLALVFTDCHPAVPPDARVALTLRLVGGLTTQEIARAFLSKAIVARMHGRLTSAR